MGSTTFAWSAISPSPSLQRPWRRATKGREAFGRWALLLAALAGLIFLGAARSNAPAIRQDHPPRYLIYGGWHGEVLPTPPFILQNRAFLESQPFDGLVVYMRTSVTSVNVTTRIMNNTPVDYSDIATTLDPLRNLGPTSLAHNFAFVIGNSPPDFFDNWAVPLENFRNLARALKEAGLRGIFFDNEQYFSPWAAYPAGVAYAATKSLADYQAQAIVRGRQVMQAMVAEYPEIVVVTMHGPYLSMAAAPIELGFYPTNEHFALLGPFFAGFQEGAGPLSENVDGGELYTLRTAEEFQKNYEWRKTTIASEEIDCEFISPILRKRWADRSSLAYGIFDRPIFGRPMDPPTLTQTLTHALARSDRWVWLYAEVNEFLLPESEGGASHAWVEAVRHARTLVLPAPAPPEDKDEGWKPSCGFVHQPACRRRGSTRM